jgi:serine phosphatase RsbU (regulator of sigma subunit)
VSLRWKLFLSLTIPLLVTTGVLGAGGAHWLRAKAAARLPGELAALALSYADRVGGRLAGPAQTARAAAAVLAAGPAPGEAALREVVRSTLAVEPLAFGVSITVPAAAGAARSPAMTVHGVRGPNGPAWVDPPGPAAADAAAGEARAAAREGLRATWGGPYQARYAGEAVLVRVYSPIDRAGSPVGGVGVELAADHLQAALTPDPVDRFRFILVGEGGVLISHPEAARVGTQTLEGLARELRLPALAELAARVAGGGVGAARLDPYGEAPAHWAFYAPVPGTPWVFAAVAAEAELLAPVEDQIRAAAVGLGLLAAALLVLAFLVASSFARPVTRMASTARQVLEGVSDPGDPERFGADELGTVGRALYVLGRAAGDQALHRGRRAEDDAERARLLAERDDRARAYQRLVDERDEQLREYRRVVEERDEQVREYRRVVQERDRHAEALNGLALERQELEGRVAEAERELARLTGRVAERRRLQATLLADTAPPPLTDPDLEVCARIQPAAEAAGDFVDFFKRPDGWLVLVSGDASAGAGAGPTLAGLVRALVRRYAGEGRSPGAVLSVLHRTLVDAAGGVVSLGLFVAVYRPDLGELTYANAGHRPPLSFDRSGGVYPLGQSRGRPVGEEPGGSYPEGIASLVGGEALVIATDGAAGARAPDGGVLGEDRLSLVLTTHAAETAQTLCGLLVDAVADHVAGQARDDVAVLVLRRPPGPVVRPAPAHRWVTRLRR